MAPFNRQSGTNSNYGGYGCREGATGSTHTGPQESLMGPPPAPGMTANWGSGAAFNPTVVSLYFKIWESDHN